MTIAQELIDAKAKIAELEKSVIEATALIAERDKSIATLEASVKALTDEKGALVAEHSKAIGEVTGKLDAEIKARAEDNTASTLAIAERDKKLRDPAYKMASVEGDKTGAPEGGFAKSEPDMTQAQALATYRKLDGKPAEQKAFRVANWRVLGCDEEK